LPSSPEVRAESVWLLQSVLQPLGMKVCVAVLCPDNDVSRPLDERRILWAMGDIVENRPALSRWHPDYAQAFASFAKEG
jgi:hypothetical protein